MWLVTCCCCQRRRCVCVCVYEQQQIPVQQISTDNKDDDENPSSSSIKQNNVTDRNSNVKCSKSTDKSKRCNSNFKHTKSNTKPHQVSVLNHTNERYRAFIPNHSNVPIKQQLTLCVFSSSIKVNWMKNGWWNELNKETRSSKRWK